jgi:uncharacterized membrane protein YesL
MRQAFAAVWRALRLWWHDSFLFILLNIGWLVMQIPVITGPAATAALYSVARKASQGDFLTPADALAEMRRLFIPAIKWGVLNLGILGTVAANFYLYREADGIYWMLLRGLWGGIGALWLAINCFYWPFWLEQDQPTMRQTLYNCCVLLAKRPIYALSIFLITLVVAAISIGLTLPFGAALMTWIALIGTTAVEDELARVRAAHAAASNLLEANG